jgi:hypothetical protein
MYAGDDEQAFNGFDALQDSGSRNACILAKLKQSKPAATTRDYLLYTA